jgi:hypothetical protein
MTTKTSIIFSQKEIEMLGESSEEINKVTTECLKLLMSLNHTLEINSVIWRLRRLVAFKPLSPLTGEKSEWMQVSGEREEGIVYQNVRCGVVFKTVKASGEEKCEMIGAIRFTDSNGNTFTNDKSRIEIPGFPFDVPDTKVLNYEESKKYLKEDIL